MAFRWRAQDGPLILVFGIFLLHQTNEKRCQGWTPLAKLSGAAHVVVTDKLCIIRIMGLIRIMGFYQLRLTGNGTDLESQLKT